MGAGVLEAVARLVGELTEIDLLGVARPGQHADIGARAEHLFQGRGEDHGTHLRMLEAQALDGVMKLDIDTEIVGVELERVARRQPAVLAHVECERRHPPFGREAPVLVPARMGLEVDHRRLTLIFASTARGRNRNYHACAAPVARARAKATAATRAAALSAGVWPEVSTTRSALP